jgi:hypothetical protein
MDQSGRDQIAGETLAVLTFMQKHIQEVSMGAPFRVATKVNARIRGRL